MMVDGAPASGTLTVEEAAMVPSGDETATGILGTLDEEAEFSGEPGYSAADEGELILAVWMMVMTDAGWVTVIKEGEAKTVIMDG